MRYEAFFSYNRDDKLYVIPVAEALRRRGITVFLDQLELMPGGVWRSEITDAMSASECVVVFLGAHGLGPVHGQEVRLALDLQHRQQGRPRIVPAILHGFDSRRLSDDQARASTSGQWPGVSPGDLARFTFIDLSMNGERGIDELAGAIRNSTASRIQSTLADLDGSLNPFRGLNAFREEDSPFFFGRDEDVAALAALVAKPHRFAAVVGGSGSGKSSVVFAGLLPRLKASGQGWAVRTMRPGADPFLALTTSLTNAPGSQSAVGAIEAERQRLYGLIASGTQGVVARLIQDLAPRAMRPGESCQRILLVVDQFEELFTLVEQRALRDRFIDELVSATTATVGPPIHVLVTFRADNYANVTSDARLSRLFEAAQLPLREMSEAGLQAVIEKPAARVGLTYDNGLVATILDEMRGQTNALPLLEFLLDQLWIRRDVMLRRLTVAAYREVGGVSYSIATRAEEVLKGLDERSQRTARRLLEALVRPGVDGAQDSRRPIALANLSPDERAVADRLANARLLNIDQERVELIHEALISRWQTLRDWVDADRLDKIAVEDLRRDSARWAAEVAGKDKRAKGHLLGGLRLLEATDLQTRRPDLTEREAMIQKFVAASAAEEKAEANRKQSERARVWRSVSAAAMLVSIGLFGLAGWALNSNWEMMKANSAQQASQKDADATRTASLAASERFVNIVADRLSKTEGVPPSAVADVLQEATKLAAGKDANAGDKTRLVTQVDALTVAAESRLAVGGIKVTEALTKEAEQRLTSACPTPGDKAACGWRHERLELINLELKMLADPTSLAEVAGQTEALAVRIEQGPSAAEPIPPNAGDLGSAELTPFVLTARGRLDAATARLRLYDRGGDVAVLKAAEAGLRPCLARSVPRGATWDPASAIAVAACQQALAETLSLISSSPEAADATAKSAPADKSGAATEALDLAHKAADGLTAVLNASPVGEASGQAGTDVGAEASKPEAKNIVAKRLLALAKITIAQTELSSGRSADGNPAQHLAEARADLERLASGNVDNLVLMDAYIDAIQSVELALKDKLTSAAPPIPTTDRISEFETVLDLIDKRLPDLDKTTAELPFRRSQAARNLATLVKLLQSSDDKDPKAAIRWFERFEDRKITDNILKDGTGPDLRAVLVTLYYAGLSYRDVGKFSVGFEEKALDTFDRVSTFCVKAPHQGDDGSDKTAGDDIGPLCRYLWSWSVQQLSLIDIERIDPHSNLDKRLKLIEDRVQQAQQDDPSNIEFKIDYAKVLAARGRWLVKNNDIAGAKPLLAQAGRLGDQTAINQLRLWSLQSSKAGGVSANDTGTLSAEAMELQNIQRTSAIVPSAIHAHSKVLGSGDFSVYLTAEHSGGDAVRLEIERLQKYYGVDRVEPADEKRLRAIYDAAARETAQFTSVDLKKALDAFDAEGKLRALYSDSKLATNLANADRSNETADYPAALQALDTAKTSLESVSGGDAYIRDALLLSTHYLLLSEKVNEHLADNTFLIDNVKAENERSIAGQAGKSSDQLQSLALDALEEMFKAPDPSDRPRTGRFESLANRIQEISDTLDRDIPNKYSLAANMTLGALTSAIIKLRSSDNLEITGDTALSLVRDDYNSGLYLWRVAYAQLQSVHTESYNRKLGRENARKALEALLKAQIQVKIANEQVSNPVNSRQIRQFEIEISRSLAKVYSLLDEDQTAVRVFHQTIALADKLLEEDPANQEVRKSLAEAFEGLADLAKYLAKGNLDKADDFLNVYLKSQPEDQQLELKNRYRYGLYLHYGEGFNSHKSWSRPNEACGHISRINLIEAAAVTPYDTSKQGANSPEPSKAGGKPQKAASRVEDTSWTTINPESDGDLYQRQIELLQCAIDTRMSMLLLDPEFECACKISHDFDVLIRAVEERGQDFNLTYLPSIQNFVDIGSKSWQRVADQVGRNPSDKISQQIVWYKAAIEWDYARALINGPGSLQERHSNAVKEFEKVAENLRDWQSIDPETNTEYAKVQSDLAYSYLVTGDLDRAREHIEAAEKYNPGTGNIEVNHAHVKLLTALRSNSSEQDALSYYASFKSKVLSSLDTENKVPWRDQALADLRELRGIYPELTDSVYREVEDALSKAT